MVMSSDDDEGRVVDARRSQLVEELARVTQLPTNDAHALLNECDWDIVCAIKKFELETSSNEDADSHHLTPSTSTEGMSQSATSLHAPGYTFSLPDMQSLPADFRSFLEKDLIEAPTQRRLENSRHLNWWQAVGQKLWPLSTQGDGNCLAHSISLSIWGFHDRQLMLRSALHEMLRWGSRRGAIRRRWRWAESEANQALGLRLSDEEWEREWEAIVDAASPAPRSDSSSGKNEGEQLYESLEAVHVFALAHVLKRPIIVIADTVLRNAKGEELSPVAFGGVYLPLECPPQQCHKSPLVLCYDSAHFSALVTMRQDSALEQIVPITDSNRNLLPLHFAVDPGPDFTWWKDEADARIAKGVVMSTAQKLATMAEYLDLLRLELRRGSLRRTTPIRPRKPVTQKSATLANSGVTRGESEKKRILTEIGQHVRRGLRLGHSPRLEARDKGVSVDQVSIESLGSAKTVLAARLYTAGHEYMDEMVRSYLTSARERFLNSRGNSSTTTPNGRRRLNRSFSASSIVVNCINRHCSKPASQATNFLCESCFEVQKELMTSFSYESTSRPRGFKSSTMPALSEPLAPLLFSPSSRQPSDESGPVVSGEDGRLTLAVRDLCQPTESLSTKVRAVDDADGVTHYIVDSSSLSSPSSPSSSPLPPPAVLSA